MSDEQEKDTQAAADKRRTIYINRLTMYGQPAADGGQAPRIYWALFDGNPRIEVRTNVESDQNNNYGKITAPMDLFTAGVVADILKRASKADNGFREKVIIRSTWHNGERFDSPKEINSVIIGKDSEGMVYISVHEENRPNIRFFFAPSKWHSLVKQDGEAYAKAELSCIYARCYADVIMNVISTIVGYGSYVSTYTDFDGQNDPQSKPNFNQKPNYNRGGGGGGGYNKGNYNNRGGYNKGGYNKGGYNKGGYNKGGYGGGGNYQNNDNRYNKGQQSPQPSDIADEDIDY